MSELRSVIDAARELRARGEPFLSATVVRVRGSSYRRPGARMVAAHERWVAGSISGGCLEREVLTRGFWRTRDAAAVLVTYNEAEDALDDRAGSGCQGVIDMLVERFDPGAPGPTSCDWFELADACVQGETEAASITVFRSTLAGVPVGARLTLRDGVVRSTLGHAGLEAELEAEARAALAMSGLRGSYVIERGELDLLVERVAPPPHLFVFGSGHDTTPLVRFAKELGWSVTVWDALPRISTRERLRIADRYLASPLAEAIASLDRCARPVAVVMGHHLEQDRSALAALLESRARYIGVLGPRRRTEQLLADCNVTDAATRARVYAPVGLSLGAETPAEIAMSILAEAQAVLNDARARGLRDAPGAIHEPGSAQAGSSDAPELQPAAAFSS